MEFLPLVFLLGFFLGSCGEPSEQVNPSSYLITMESGFPIEPPRWHWWEVMVAAFGPDFAHVEIPQAAMARVSGPIYATLGAPSLFLCLLKGDMGTRLRFTRHKGV